MSDFPTIVRVADIVFGKKKLYNRLIDTLCRRHPRLSAPDIHFILNNGEKTIRWSLDNAFMFGEQVYKVPYPTWRIKEFRIFNPNKVPIDSIKVDIFSNDSSLYDVATSKLKGNVKS